ncbi:MAG: TAXI family TRAP transporter solute-binding subunit [Pseudomonadota bacterium]|nr:TAXI family TRAP transporter solute-binding subunit [Pseudomonadota bacterium]
MSRLRLFAVLFAVLPVVPQVARASDVLDIVTGPKTGTYYAIGRDIAAAAAQDGLAVDVKPSEGSIDNIRRVNDPDRAVVGIVQSDVLGFLSRSKNPASMHMAAGLRMIFPLYDEEVHVLTRDSIHSFADLKGKKVAVGQEGSGNLLTALNLFAMMNVAPAQMEKISPAEGVVAVLKGEIDAVIFVGGKPVRLFKNLEDLTLPENQQYAAMLSGVHFLPLVAPRMLAEYKPAEITHADYSFVQQTVPTIAVQAVLVGYDVPQDGKSDRAQCRQVAALAGVIRKALPDLRKKGHPKWKEVNLDADASPWKKDACVWPETSPKADAGKSGLMEIVEKNKGN